MVTKVEHYHAQADAKTSQQSFDMDDNSVAMNRGARAGEWTRIRLWGRLRIEKSQ